MQLSSDERLITQTGASYCGDVVHVAMLDDQSTLAGTAKTVYSAPHKP